MNMRDALAITGNHADAQEEFRSIRASKPMHRRHAEQLGPVASLYKGTIQELPDPKQDNQTNSQVIQTKQQITYDISSLLSSYGPQLI